MLYCLIAFILGWLVSKMMGNGFSVGGQSETGRECFDHKDNDGDGLKDCKDPDCFNNPRIKKKCYFDKMSSEKIKGNLHTGKSAANAGRHKYAIDPKCRQEILNKCNLRYFDVVNIMASMVRDGGLKNIDSGIDVCEIKMKKKYPKCNNLKDCDEHVFKNICTSMINNPNQWMFGKRN